MNENVFFFISKTHTVILILIKISLLLKYFLFMKFKESTWKVQHMVYFGEREIMFSSCYKQAMVKKIQNSLTTSIFHLAIMVVLIRLAVIALK